MSVILSGNRYQFSAKQGGYDRINSKAVLGDDNLSAGIATAAFVTYLSSLTNVAFSATQYALFSSIMLLMPKLLAGFSGQVVEQIGYSSFFVGTSLLGIPVMILIIMVAKRGDALLPQADK